MGISRPEAFDRIVAYVRSIIDVPAFILKEKDPKRREQLLGLHARNMWNGLSPDVADVSAETGLSRAMIQSVVEKNSEELTRALGGRASVRYWKGKRVASTAGFFAPGCGHTASREPAHLVVTLKTPNAARSRRSIR